MVSLLASGAVDPRLEPQSGQTKDYELVFVKHAVLRRKSKDWVAQNLRVGRRVCPQTVVSVN
jgi:hypothetical protein